MPPTTHLSISNAALVRTAMRHVQTTLEATDLGDPRDIVKVAAGRSGVLRAGLLSDKEWRLIRFALAKAIETL
jgi:hypothetical protein